MSRLWQSGFELNSTTTDVEFSIFNDAVTIDSVVKRTGDYSFKVSDLSSGSGKYLGYDTGTSSAKHFFYRFYFRVDTLPTANNAIIYLNNSSANTTPIVSLTLSSTGTLQLADEDGSIGSPSSALNTSTWYRIELEVDASLAAGSQVITARVDGVNFATASDRSLSSTALRWLLFGGNLASEAQTTGVWYFDDLAINNASGSFQNSWPGAGGIIHLRPDADGDNSGWSGDWQNVDEITPDDNTTKVVASAQNTIDDHNLTASGLSVVDSINVVAIGTRFRAASATTPASFVLRTKASSGGTVEESASIAPTTTTWLTNAVAAPRNYPLVLYDLPGASTTAWTSAELDTAQIGYRVDSAAATNNAEISTVWLSIDYTEAGATTTSTSSTSSSTSSTSISTSSTSVSNTTSTSSTSTSKSTSTSSTSSSTSSTSMSTSTTTLPAVNIRPVYSVPHSFFPGL